MRSRDGIPGRGWLLDCGWRRVKVRSFQAPHRQTHISSPPSQQLLPSHALMQPVCSAHTDYYLPKYLMYLLAPSVDSTMDARLLAELSRKRKAGPATRSCLY